MCALAAVLAYIASGTRMCTQENEFMQQTLYDEASSILHLHLPKMNSSFFGSESNRNSIHLFLGVIHYYISFPLAFIKIVYLSCTPTIFKMNNEEGPTV